MLYRQSKHTFCVKKLFYENRTVYEIIYKNMVQPHGPKTTIWCMRITSWIPNQRIQTRSDSLVHFISHGGTRWRSWLRHCATSREVVGSIPEGVTRIFH
jgi:hypothetical protein